MPCGNGSGHFRLLISIEPLLRSSERNAAERCAVSLRAAGAVHGQPSPNGSQEPY